MCVLSSCRITSWDLILRAKEKGDQVPSVSGGAKWRRMAQLWDQLFIKDGALYRRFHVLDSSSSVIQLIVPDTLKEKVMYGVHEGIGGGHLGWRNLLPN